MNPNIRKLAAIAAKNERRIIGLMSGTSLDGLDVAICRMSGAGFETSVIVEHFETVEYEASFKKELRDVCFKETISLSQLTLVNKHIAEKHAAIVNKILAQQKISNRDIDLIASHGQTVYHAPLADNKATLQIGDGDLIAVKTGIITSSDFRQKHIAGGGEGAPLAAYGDYLLFTEKSRDVVMLNIGGIANLSFMPAGEKMMSTDIGPGNTLMDGFMQQSFPGKYFDKDAAIALTGKVNEELLVALKAHSFFEKPFPKTTGPELFNGQFLEDALQKVGKNLSPEDIMATLNYFSAAMIIEAINKMTAGKKYMMYISGGGLHNPLLVQHLKEGLPDAEIHDTTEKNIPPDGKEAVLFALLANECVAGSPEIFANISTGMPSISMGKISFPG